MNRNVRLLVLLCGTAAALGLAACSSSDSNPTTPPAADTQPPQVIATEPEAGRAGIAKDRDVAVLFSEPVDQATVAGNITLSSGTITGMTWQSDRIVVISHTDWAEGVQVTVTVGTGVKDLAGNAMTAASSTSFWTVSTALTLLSVTPADGGSGVELTSDVVLQFSRDVDETSLAGHVTLTDQLVKAVFPYTTTRAGVGRYRLSPTGPLPASTVVFVAVTAGLQANSGGATLVGNHITSFTTGTTSDTTPPTLISADPAIGATDAPAGQGFVRFTFSEPVEPESLSLEAVNVELYFQMIQFLQFETFWTEDNTVLTIPLPTDLPAGLPMGLEISGITDRAGNAMAGTIAWSATVAGAPEYVPWVDGTRYIEDHGFESGPLGEAATDSRDSMLYVLLDRLTDTDVRYENYDDTFTTPTGAWQQYRRTANAIQWVGFEDSGKSAPADKSTVFDTPVTYLPLPLAVGTWTSNTTVTVPGEGTYTAQLHGQVLGRVDAPVPGEGGRFYFKDAWRVVQTLDASLDGTPAISQTDTLTVAASLGVVLDHHHETNLMESRWQDDLIMRLPALAVAKAAAPGGPWPALGRR